MRYEGVTVVIKEGLSGEFDVNVGVLEVGTDAHFFRRMHGVLGKLPTDPR